MRPIRSLLTLLILCALPSTGLLAQNVGINATGAAPAAGAMLDVDAANRGVLIPRVALVAANNPNPVGAANVVQSLLVYNTATAGAALNAVTPGYYYWSGAPANRWLRVANDGDAWRTTGNAGTVAGTNFIGTTDAVDFVVKTGGAAAANERMRVLSGGKVVVNNTGVGALANDVFSVYANGTTNGTTANTSDIGLRAVVGYTSTGFGVSGFATGATGTSFGVYAQSAPATGTGNAVRAEAWSPTSRAVLGISNINGGGIVTNQQAFSVFGQVNGTLAGGLASGVLGITAASMTTGDARGVTGQSASNSGTGVLGFATSTTLAGTKAGVWGQAFGATGWGVVGVGGPDHATLGNFGVWGQTSNRFGAGVRAVNTSTNILATSFPDGVLATNQARYGAAVYAENLQPLGTALIAEGNGVFTVFPPNGAGGSLGGSTIGGIGYASSTSTTVNSTGLIGLGNGINNIAIPAGGAGVTARGLNVGSYNFATTGANSTAVVGAANNIGAIIPVGGAGGSFVGTDLGVYARGTADENSHGIMAAGNNVVPITAPDGAGGTFRGRVLGAIGNSTIALDGVGLVGMGNNLLTYIVPLTGAGVAGTGTNYGVVGYANSDAVGTLGAPVRAGGYFQSGTVVQTATWVAAYDGAGNNRKVVGDGTVNTIVKDLDGKDVLLSAPEAPENLFQDFGEGQLIDGRAIILLDPILSRNIHVDAARPLRVFVQLRGDCNGVYVTNESATGFEVVELMGGTSNAKFFWTVTANRANVEHANGQVWNYAEERFPLFVRPEASVRHALTEVQEIHVPVAPEEGITREGLREKKIEPLERRPAMEPVIEAEPQPQLPAGEGRP